MMYSLIVCEFFLNCILNLILYNGRKSFSIFRPWNEESSNHFAFEAYYLYNAVPLVILYNFTLADKRVSSTGTFF